MEVTKGINIYFIRELSECYSNIKYNHIAFLNLNAKLPAVYSHKDTIISIGRWHDF